MERTPRMLRNAATARQAAARSMVLLKNKDNTLPLVPDGENPLAIAVFGVGQIRTVKGGTGSGEVNSVDNISFLDGLSQCDKLAPDALLARRYRSWCLAHPEPTGPSFLGPASNCSPEMPLDELDLDAYAQSCAAAVLVISRIAGEGGDMTCDPGALALTETESAMIRSVCEHFSRTVLVLNTPGYIELADVLPALGAVVFAGLPGQQAGPALADVLTGTVPPSGHLSDTWPLSCSDYPNMDWFGSGDENGISHNGMTGLQHQINIPYHDDIYVGYRYFDTFGLPVLFPFGHGLTYGDPLLTGCSVACTGDTVSVSAQIRNRSADFACSEVVQVYVSCPSGKLEQPYQRLAAFCKTEDILPDSETDVHLRFSLTELSSFDEARSSYVLEPGYYDVRVGFSSRETRVAGSLYLPCEQIVQKLHGCTTDLPEDFFRLSSGKAVPITYPGEAEELEHSRRLAIRLSARLVETET